MSRFMLISSVFLVCAHCAPNNSTLQLVHIIFRHGDRTNNPDYLYSKDPHKNYTYPPYGVGHLTNRGKMREYCLGKLLRERYCNFLPELYHPEELKAYSSPVDRTKTSLQLVLAGLYPPVGDLIWNEQINWQPIPFEFYPEHLDTLFLSKSCPQAKIQLETHLKSPQFTATLNQYKNQIEYIEKHTEQNYFDDPEELFLLYVGLSVENENNLTLPEWTKEVYPSPLDKLALKFYEANTANNELKKYASGYLLKKIIDDSLDKIDGRSRERKLFLYSGHEFNVAFLVYCFQRDLLQRVPPYGSFVAIEVHKIGGVDGIKIFYRDSNEENDEPVKVEGCDYFCPIDRFLELCAVFLPKTDSCYNFR